MGAGAKSKQKREVHDFARFARLNDQGNLGASLSLTSKL